MSRPTVISTAADDITPTTATANGAISDTGAERVSKRGFVLSTTSHGDPGNVGPQASGYEEFGEEQGNFVLQPFDWGFTHLTKDQIFYFRAYAKNPSGYSYSAERWFVTPKEYYPTAIYPPRTKLNKIGADYRPQDPYTFFAPDVTKLDDEVVAIENELGTSPKGLFADVKAAISDKLSKSVLDQFYALGYVSALSDSDDIIIEDASAAYAKRGSSISALKAFLKTYNDGLYFAKAITNQINALTAKGYITGGDVFVIEDEEAAWAKKKINLSNIFSYMTGNLVDYFQDQGYVLNGYGSLVSPLDATTYFLGSAGYTLGTGAGFSRYRIPKAGHIKKITLEVYYSGVASTAETSVINLKVGAGANVQILNNLKTNSNGAAYTSAALNIAVAAGDYIELNWVTPTWVTNPVSVVLKNMIYIED